MARHFMLTVAAGTLCATTHVVFAQQATTEPRHISASQRPIIELLEPGDRHIVVWRFLIAEPIDIGEKSFVAAIVEYNPAIFYGHVVRKQPVFLDTRNAAVLPSVVSMAEANWIGSLVTMQVERVIQSPADSTLVAGDRLTFMVDSDGSATINGTRVDTETQSLWPIEAGKRYLVTGDFRQDEAAHDSWFVPSGMWLERSVGAPLRGPNRKALAPDGSLYETLPTFERQEVVTDLYSVTFRLEQEVAKPKAKPE